MSVDNSTSVVTITLSGTGWIVDVTPCNLDSNLNLKDFVVEFDGEVVSNDNFTKTTRVLLTYTGDAIDNVVVSIYRSTPITRIEEIQYTQRLQSATYEEELNRIHRLLSETSGITGNNKVKVSPLDSTGNFLLNKIVPGTNISIVKQTPGSAEVLQISSTVPMGGSVNVLTIDLISTELSGVGTPEAGTNTVLFANGYTTSNDGGGGSFYWDESDTTSTVDNGLYFQVAGNDDNGRWVRVREDKQFWSVAWYGIFGDNTTDNYTRLAALQNTIVTGFNDQLNVIYFPASSLSYLFSRNTWTMNIRYLLIAGYGASFRNTSTSTEEIDRKYIFRFNTAITENGINEIQTSYTNKTTYSFESANEGAFTINLSVAGTGNNFAVGEEVLISGKKRDKEGATPNLSFFEIMLISSISGDSLTFTAPIIHRYVNEWGSKAFLTATYGNPRVTKLDHNDSIATRSLHLCGMTIKGHTTDGESFLAPSATARAEVRDVILEGSLLVENCKYLFASNCFILNQVVPKILNDYVEIKDCEIGNHSASSVSAIADGSGTRHINITHNKIFGSIKINPIEFGIIKENNILAGVNNTGVVLGHNDVYSTGLLQIENNIIDAQTQASNGDNPTVHPYGTLKTLTVGSVSGTNILMSESEFNFFILHRQLLEGHYIISEDGSNGGTVTSVTFDGTNYVLSGTWDQPVVNDVFVWLPCQAANIRGNFVKSTTRGAAEESTGLLRNLPDYPFYMGQNEQYREVVITSEMMGFEGSLNSFTEVLGYLVSLEINILKPYSGTDPNNLVIRIEPTAANDVVLGVLELNLKLRRQYRFNLDALTSTRDDYNGIYDLSGFGVFIHKLNFRFLLGGGEYLESNNSYLPKGYIKLSLYNPRANRADTTNTAN